MPFKVTSKFKTGLKDIKVYSVEEIDFLIQSSVSYTTTSGGGGGTDVWDTIVGKPATSSAWNAEVGLNVLNWDTAYSWGDHAGLYSLLGHTHLHTDITDFDAEVSAIITADVDKVFVDALNVDADTLDSQDGTYYLAWANLTGVPSTFAPSPHTLDSHSNVTITANSAGEILKWSGTAWINNTFAEAGISVVGHTHTISDITDLSSYTGFDARYYTEAEVDALTWNANDITAGTFADARIAQSNVTQHQAALSITESQISDLQAYVLPNTSPTFTGATFSGTADPLVTIQNTGVGGAVLRIAVSDNTKNSAIQFGDPEDNNVGRIVYDHSADTMDFYASGVEYANLSSSALTLLTDLQATTATFSGLISANAGIAFDSNSNIQSIGNTDFEIGSDGSIVLMIDKNDNDTSQLLKIRANDSATNLLTVSQEAVLSWQQGNISYDDTDGFHINVFGSATTPTFAVQIAGNDRLEVTDTRVNSLVEHVIDMDTGFTTATSGSYNLILRNQGNISADGSYGASIAFGHNTGDADRAAIAWRQQGTDSDRGGLAFFGHSATSTDPLVEAFHYTDTAFVSNVPITLPGDPTSALQAATKQYVDAQSVTTEDVEDIVANLISAGTNMSVVYDDGAGTLTLSSTAGTGGSTSLSGLNDTSISGVADGELLQWYSTGSHWRNRTIAELGLLTDSGFTMAGNIEMSTNQLAFPYGQILSHNVSPYRGILYQTATTSGGWQGRHRFQVDYNGLNGRTALEIYADAAASGSTVAVSDKLTVAGTSTLTGVTTLGTTIISRSQDHLRFYDTTLGNNAFYLMSKTSDNKIIGFYDTINTEFILEYRQTERDWYFRKPLTVNSNANISGTVGLAGTRQDNTGTSYDQVTVGNYGGAEGLLFQLGTGSDGALQWANSTTAVSARILWDKSENTLKLQSGTTGGIDLAPSAVNINDPATFSASVYVVFGGTATNTSAESLVVSRTANPAVILDDNNAAANEAMAAMRYNNGQLQFLKLNDNLTDGQYFATVDTTNNWQFSLPATFNGAVTVSSGGIDVTGNSSITGNIDVSGLVDGRDISADGTTQDNHIADGTIHYTQDSISITESQISDLGSYLPLGGGTLSGSTTFQNGLLVNGSNDTGKAIRFTGTSPDFYIYPNASNGMLFTFTGTGQAELLLSEDTVDMMAGNLVVNASAVTFGVATSGISYSDLSDIPTTFTPTSHTHVIADITDFTDNSTNWNTAYTYSQVGHLPLTGGTLSSNVTIDTQVANQQKGRGYRVYGRNNVEFAFGVAKLDLMVYDDFNDDTTNSSQLSMGVYNEENAANFNWIASTDDIKIYTNVLFDQVNFASNVGNPDNDADAAYSPAIIIGSTITFNNATSGIDYGDLSNVPTTFTPSSHTHVIADITDFTDNSTNWDAAHSWGDHALVGYLTSYTETDPVFVASEAASITAQNKTDWTAGYNYSQVGHLPLAGGTVTGTLNVRSSGFDTIFVGRTNATASSGGAPIYFQKYTEGTTTLTSYGRMYVKAQDGSAVNNTLATLKGELIFSVYDGANTQFDNILLLGHDETKITNRTIIGTNNGTDQELEVGVGDAFAEIAISSQRDGDGESIGRLGFYGRDNTAVRTLYAGIKVSIEDNTNTTENGQLHFEAIDDGSFSDLGIWSWADGLTANTKFLAKSNTFDDHIRIDRTGNSSVEHVFGLTVSFTSTTSDDIVWRNSTDGIELARWKMATADNSVNFDFLSNTVTAGAFVGDGTNITNVTAAAVDWSDVTSKPTIGNGTLTMGVITNSGLSVSVGPTFTANQTSAKTINFDWNPFNLPVQTAAINAIVGMDGSQNGRRYESGDIDVSFFNDDGTYASSSHNHSASNITSGTLAEARLPNTLTETYSFGTVLAPSIDTQTGWQVTNVDDRDVQELIPRSAYPSTTQPFFVLILADLDLGGDNRGMGGLYLVFPNNSGNGSTLIQRVTESTSLGDNLWSGTSNPAYDFFGGISLFSWTNASATNKGIWVANDGNQTVNFKYMFLLGEH